MAQTSRSGTQRHRRPSSISNIALDDLLAAVVSQDAPSASLPCSQPASPSTSPIPSKRPRKRRGNNGARVQCRLIQPSDASTWGHKSQNEFARMSAKTQRQWHHITHIEGTDAGRDADVRCTECKRRNVVCRVYTETAMAVGDNLGRACSHCREIQKKPCSFVRKRRELDSSDSCDSCDSSGRRFVLRDDLDAALARIDTLQAELRRLKKKQ